MTSYRKSTIKDVAARAQVSVTTVSHVVSQRKDACSPETARRVQEAIAALHYRPSGITPMRRNTKTLGVYFDLGFETDGDQRGTYLARLWRGISRGAGLHNYCLLYYPPEVRQHVEDFAVFLDGRVDGVLLAGAESDDPRLAFIAASGIPIALVSQSQGIPVGVAAAYINEHDVVELALNYLWTLGHRRIAHIAGPLTTRLDEVAIFRRDHYIEWLKAHNAYDPDLVAVADTWTPTCLTDFVDAWRVLPEPPTAVFCANDSIAICLIENAQKAGWRVPEDVSVIGVDNIAASSETNPPLTTIDIPMETVGLAAVGVLLRLMEGGEGGQCREVIPVNNMIIRGSAQAPHL